MSRSNQYKNVRITIELRGRFPEKHLTRKNIKRIEDRIKEAATPEFAQYDFLGEFFGNDPDMYALFLGPVKLVVEETK